MDGSTPAGKWYLVANGYRLELTLSFANNAWSGTIQLEGAALEVADQVSWDAAGRWLEFRRNAQGGVYQWYRLSLTYGVVSGRFSSATTSAKPAYTAYTYHCTGWSPTWLDTDIVPRTWNLTMGAYSGVLRIDRDCMGNLRGRMKVYSPGEELEDDLSAITWDGHNIQFTRQNGWVQVYTGTANGRFINGTFTHNGGAPSAWNGVRGEVLGFGLGSRLPYRDNWQAATRAALINLTDGMRLISVGVPAVSAVLQPAAQSQAGFPPERDDDPNSSPPSYTLQQVTFTTSPGSRFDPANPPPARVWNGMLATPTGAVPPGGFRAIVVVNGHGGSAQNCIASNSDLYWYGESAARHGFLVLAVDIGHRPKWGTGPVVHPAIVDAGYPDSNWEEDGERSFDVRRAIDWLLTQPNVRRDHVLMWGLSMGGELTAITCALDPRIAMSIPCGFSPDMHVMDGHGNHPCYKWDRADIHEYLDVSDWFAMIAPRPLVVETGVADFTFSSLNPPFCADKQVTRRARAAYGPQRAKLIHYLHYDQHHPHVGSLNPTNPNRPRNVLAAAVIEPATPGDHAWQTDGTTTVRSPTLYDLITELLP